jgi:DNA uptake protein ComE-like DNA-binding protein
MALNRLAVAAFVYLSIHFGSPGAGLDAQVGRSQGVLDANTARDNQLVTLPHLTPALVKAIIDRRPFASIKDLDNLLQPLTPQQRAELYRRVFVTINLNTATRDEILLIPGLGERMAHEFEEYRPYKALAQFRKEIGKYVDQKEVARLEQYVFVPINLNTATDADILSIPGVGQRMLHEFKEYRPYKAIEQFRREIGKYVSKQEVARMERYVTLN